jgi:hypothetical protein
MKRPATASACPLLTTIAPGVPSVEVLMVRPSSQTLRISVLQEGNRLQNAMVEVFREDGKSRFSLSTEEHGVAILPPRPSRGYNIAATTAGHLRADLLLDISKHKSNKPSELSLQLHVVPPTLEELIVAAEESARTEWLREFEGVAVDPTGANLPQTRIDIFQQSSGGRVRVTTIESDATGHFSTHLPDGVYTATFQVHGFARQIHVFEINQDADQKDLRIRLDLAPSM